MADETQPVNRTRRSRFIFAVTGFCLLTAFIVTIYASFGTASAVTSPLLDLYVRGVLGLATATVITYVSGSVIDYNGGVANLFTKAPPKG